MGKIGVYIKNIYREKEGEHFIKKCEPWSVTFIGRIFGIPLARAFAKLNLHPNVITIFTIPFAFLAGVAFFYNHLILGAVLYFISLILDCSDGVLARLTKTSSKRGEKLDYYSDIANNIFMYFGLWYSQFYLHGLWFIGGFLIALHYAVIAFGYTFLKKLTYKTISKRICSYYYPADEGFLTFFVLPPLGVFCIGFPVLIILQFISYSILFVRQKEKPNIWKNIKSMFKI
jgi:phosphatidylglycerophosphate synthase